MESILESLLPVSEHWYQIGCALHVGSGLLHTLDKDFTNATSREDKLKRLQALVTAWAYREDAEMVELVNAVRAYDQEVADSLALNG